MKYEWMITDLIINDWKMNWWINKWVRKCNKQETDNHLSYWIDYMVTN